MQCLTELWASWIWDLQKTTIWWVADKMSTIISGEYFSTNTLQQWVLHTCSFSCQNRKESIFLLLVTGKGKYIIYTNAHTRDVWKCSKELRIPMFLQKKKKKCYCILLFSFLEKGHLDKVYFYWKERKKKSPKDLFSNFHFKTPVPSLAERNWCISMHWFAENRILPKSTMSPFDTKRCEMSLPLCSGSPGVQM